MLFDPDKSNLTRLRAAHVINVATGTPDNVRGVKNRAVTAGGNLSQLLDADEIVELLLASIQGGVTPTASVAIANPTTAVTATPSASGGVLPSGTYLYVYTDVDRGGGETLQSSASTGGVVTGPTGSVGMTGILTGAAGTVQRRIYRNFNAGAYGLIAVINDNTTTTYTDTGSVTTAQSLLNGAPPAANTTGTGANIWVFKPSTTLDSQTWEWRDGYNDWNESGVYVDQLKITWSAKDNGDAMVDATLFGKERLIMGGGLTGALTTRVPVWIEGWETSVWMDAAGLAPGTTPFGSAISGDITIKRNLGRKYFATNTQATGAVPLGLYDLQATMLIEANAAGLAQYQNWDASTEQVVRMQFGGNGAALGASGLKRKVWIDVPTEWTVQDLTGLDTTTRVFKASAQYEYDIALGYSTQITVVNSRSTAY